jgi:hypothetical protein
MNCNHVIRGVTIAGLLIALAAPAMAGTPIRLSFHDSMVVSGSTISYPVYADSSFSGYTVSAYQLVFSYNTSLFKFTGAVSAGTLTSTWGSPTVHEGPLGTVSIVGASSDTLIGTGNLVILQFSSTQFTGPYNQGGSFTFQSAVFNEGFPTASFRNGSITLTPVPSIVVSPNTALLTKGDIQQFGVSGGKIPYTWSSTSPSVASIDSVGKMTALTAGFTKVVAVDSSGYVDTTDLVEVRAYRLSFRDTSRYQGQTVDLPIYCTDLTGLNVTSGQFTLTYNSSLWTALGTVEAGTILAPYGASQFSVSNGSISISFAGGPTPLSGSGVLVYVRFKASTLTYGGTGLSIQNALFNENLTANVGTGNLTVLSLGALTVSPGGSQNLVAGDSLHYTATGGTPPYTWSVSDSTRASISSLGWVKAIKGGSVVVTAKDSIGATGSSGTITLYDFRVSIPDTVMTSAQHVKVPIYVTPNAVGFTAFQFTVTYNTNYYLRLDTVDRAGTLSSGWLVTQSYGNGTSIIVGATGTVPGVQAGGVLLNLNFAVPDSTPKPSTTTITLASVLFNEGSPVAFVKSGSLQLANGPVFTVSPTSAALNAGVGQKDSTTLTVRNTGLANLTSSISVIGSSSFTTSTSSINVLPADSAKVIVYFQPLSAGPASATIHFVTNDPYHNPVNVSVTGSTPYPILAFNPTSINFGTVSVGFFKDTTVTISNTGTDTLKITNIIGNLSVFTARPGSANIPPGQSLVDTLRFAPSAGGNVSGRFSVTSNSLTSPDTVSASGTGSTLFPILAFSSSTVSFGNVNVASFKDTAITISNVGTDTLKILGITTSNSVFTVRPTILTIPPGQSFSDTLRFAPVVAGGYSGRIFVASNAPTSPDTIVVSGTGIPATSVKDPALIPDAYSLGQNFPNPFNPSTIIRYGLRAKSNVRLEIFNVLGQKVDALVDAEQNEGYHAVTWHASVPSGVYFYRIDAVSTNNPNERFLQIRKMVFMK